MPDIAFWDKNLLQRYIVQRIKDLKLTKRQTKDMLLYIKSTFAYALDQHYIDNNASSSIDVKAFKRHTVEAPAKSTVERTVSEAQLERLYKRFEYYHENKPKYIPVYAVELASMTGMRVGELAGLRWSDIDEQYIHICHSEKYDRLKKMYFIGETKIGKDRYFPLTEELDMFFRSLLALEKKYGYDGEFVFMSQSGRIHKSTISDCSRNLCIYMGMDAKSIHALRRTVSSKLKCAGVPTPRCCISS